MGAHVTISASEFKAKCLDILSRLADHRLTGVTVTKHGAPVAEIVAPKADRAAVEGLFGCMAGSVRFLDEVDLTEPVIDMSEWSPDVQV